VSEITPGSNYPIGVCMVCGGTLKKKLGGYRCEDCGEFFTLEEAGLQGVEITSIEDEDNRTMKVEKRKYDITIDGYKIRNDADFDRVDMTKSERRKKHRKAKLEKDEDNR